MAVFTFSEPQVVFSGLSLKGTLLGRFFQRMVDAQVKKAEREVQAHIATLDDETRSQFDLDTAIVGKKGIYAWPY